MSHRSTLENMQEWYFGFSSPNSFEYIRCFGSAHSTPNQWTPPRRIVTVCMCWKCQLSQNIFTLFNGRIFPVEPLSPVQFMVTDNVMNMKWALRVRAKRTEAVRAIEECFNNGESGMMKIGISGKFYNRFDLTYLNIQQLMYCCSIAADSRQSM